MNTARFFTYGFPGAVSALVLLLAAPAACAQPLRSGHPNLPNGTQVAVYLNCGGRFLATPPPGQDLVENIGVPRGEKNHFAMGSDTAATMVQDPERVVFELSELDPESEYTLGFTWFDGDRRGRRTAVAFSQPDGGWTEVLPATRPVAMSAGEPTWAHMLLPVPPEYSGRGAFKVAFINDEGPGVTVSELCLVKRPAGSARKRVLIVTGDDYPGHRWRETAPALAEALREDPRLEVSITESPAIYASPLIDEYDATVMHFKDYPERLAFDDHVREGLEHHVETGHGLVLAHFACGAFQEWGGFERLAGRVWNPELRGHDPHGVFEVRVIDTTHPITRGMQDFETVDELYTCLDGDVPIRVLCQATSKVDGKDYPIAFLVEDAPGRVFHCVLGHDPKAFSAKGVRALFHRGAAWTAGLAPH